MVEASIDHTRIMEAEQWHLDAQAAEVLAHEAAHDDLMSDCCPDSDYEDIPGREPPGWWMQAWSAALSDDEDQRGQEDRAWIPNPRYIDLVEEHEIEAGIRMERTALEEQEAAEAQLEEMEAGAVCLRSGEAQEPTPAESHASVPRPLPWTPNLDSPPTPRAVDDIAEEREIEEGIEITRDLEEAAEADQAHLLSLEGYERGVTSALRQFEPPPTQPTQVQSPPSPESPEDMAIFWRETAMLIVENVNPSPSLLRGGRVGGPMVVPAQPNTSGSYRATSAELHLDVPLRLRKRGICDIGAGPVARSPIPHKKPRLADIPLSKQRLPGLAPSLLRGLSRDTSLRGGPKPLSPCEPAPVLIAIDD